MLRIFIIKWVFIFILLVTNLIIGLRTSIEFFYFFFWFLLSTILINLIWLTVSYFVTKLHLARYVISKVEEDDFLEVETTIKNDGFLPIFNFVVEDNLTCTVGAYKSKQILSEYMAAKSVLKLKYTCFCPRRGKYRLGPFVVYFFDPFNLFFLKRTHYIYSELYVYPRTFRIHRFPNLTKGALPWFGIETTRVSGDEDEFFGTREYKGGDPIKRIHWLSTARKNKLIVKEYQRQSFYRATILFNLEKDKDVGEGKEKVGEYMIKIAASTAKYLIERGVSLEVIAHIGELAHLEFNNYPADKKVKKIG